MYQPPPSYGLQGAPQQQQRYLVRGKSGELYYVDEETLKRITQIQQNATQPGAQLQVPNASLAVRRRSSTSTGDQKQEGPWEKSQSVVHLPPPPVQHRSRRSSSSSQRKERRNSKSPNEPVVHLPPPPVPPHGSRRSSSSSQHQQRSSSKSPNRPPKNNYSNYHPPPKLPNTPHLGFEGLLLTSQRQPNTEQKHPVAGQPPVIGWDVGESTSQKTRTKKSSNEQHRIKTNIIPPTEDGIETLKVETASGISLLPTDREISNTNEHISQPQTSTKEVELSQLDNNCQNVKQALDGPSSESPAPRVQVNEDHQSIDIDNNNLKNIIITQLKGNQGNIINLNKGPNNISKGPSCITKGPASLNKGPIDSAKGPSEITRGPADLNKGPGNLSKGPCDLNQGPLEYNRGPLNLEKGPSKLAKGPSVLCCGPSLSIRGPSLSKGSCKAAIGPTLSKGPSILSKGSLKQAAEAV